MKLILVRHGETDRNAKRITDGHGASPLNANGRAQCELTGKRLSKERIDIMFVSDLKRTRETASIILPYLPSVPVFFDPMIREKSAGFLEGRTHEEISAYIEQHKLDWETFEPEGGESQKDLRDRVIVFFEMIQRKYPKKNLLIITHGGVIHALLQHLSLPTDDGFANCSVTIVKILEKPELLVFNDTSHLAGKK